jgi:uncharacterized protein (DUF111 family)
MRKGISGTKVTVVVENQENEKHRHLSHIEALINNSTLPDRVKEKSLTIFMRVAEAEAKVHNISKEQVHFHEVGALDSIADIVGAAICQEYLEVDEIQASPVQLGGGFVKCAHGMMPVPAPATAENMKLPHPLEQPSWQPLWIASSPAWSWWYLKPGMVSDSAMGRFPMCFGFTWLRAVHERLRM